MEKLFESIYRECHFSELKTFKSGKELASNWKDNYNAMNIRGIVFIKSSVYNNTEKSITLTFNKPIDIEYFKDYVIDNFPENKFDPFLKKPATYLLKNSNTLTVFLSTK